nr:MAG TPA: hypothetical protein [Caudoviricetes sp.]
MFHIFLNIYSITTYLSHLQNLKIFVVHSVVYLYLSYLVNILIIYLSDWI